MSKKRGLILILIGLAVVALAAIATLPTWSPAAVSLASPVIGKPPGVPGRAAARFAWGDKVYWQWCDDGVRGSAIEWRYWNDERRSVLTGPVSSCADTQLAPSDGLLAEFFLQEFGPPFEVNIRQAERPGETCGPPRSEELRALAATLRAVGTSPQHAADAAGWRAVADMVAAAGDRPDLVARDHLTRLESGLADCGRIVPAGTAAPVKEVYP